MAVQVGINFNFVDSENINISKLTLHEIYSSSQNIFERI